MSLHIHVGEPWTFERANGTCELFGSTADHLDPTREDWQVELTAPLTFEDEEFGAVTLSPRYFGESLQRIVNPLVNLAVNIVPKGHRSDAEGHPPVLAGTVVQTRRNG